MMASVSARLALVCSMGTQEPHTCTNMPLYGVETGVRVFVRSGTLADKVVPSRSVPHPFGRYGYSNANVGSRPHCNAVWYISSVINSASNTISADDRALEVQTLGT